MRPELLTATCIAFIGAAPGVFAQQAAGPPGGSGNGAAPAEIPALEEIVVTSSRAALPGFSAPTPTTVVSAATIEREDASNIATILDEIPGFKDSQSPASNNAKTASPGSSTADLRGLGAQRTLVLVDGMRVPPTAPTTNTSVVNAVDLNTIPAFMIDRVEVVTGGASAQWGSDAVAGVVNIRLKDKFEGFEIKVQGGTSQRADDNNEYAGVLGGLAFADGRGHFVAGAEFQNDSGLGDIYTRPWGQGEQQIIANPSTATNGLPALLEESAVRSALGAGGIITGPANFMYKGYTFNPGGASVRPFQYGSLISGVQMVGGEGQSVVTGFDQIPAVRRAVFYSRSSYDLTDSITASLVLSYSNSKGIIHGSLPRLTGRTISEDNPFLPADVSAAMAAEGVTSFGFTRNGFDLGNSHIRVDDQVPRAVLALNGKLAGGWSWDVGYEVGMDRYHQSADNATDNVNLSYALDAVTGPNGQPVCRATLPGPAFRAAAAGCVPINLFGNGTPSQAAIDYVQQTGISDSHYTQQDSTANIKGTPFSTWAGAVAVAAGFEYRNESQNVTTDSLAAEGVFLGAGNALPYTGSFNVKEGYIDTIVPLITDQILAKSLSFSGAARVEHYSDVGNQHTWKIGADYEPVSGLRFRGTHSIDIRAPQLYELYGGGQLVTNTATVNGVTANIPQNVTAGNRNLSAENATTNTYGIVFQPRGVLSGLSSSVDYYNIKIDNAISSLTAATIANLCSLGNKQFCDFFTFNAAGVPTSLTATVLNVASVQTQGVDFNVAYQKPLPSLFNRPTSITSSLLGTYTLHSYVNTGGGAATIDRAGENGPQNLGAMPRLTSNASETLTIGGVALTAQGLFVSKGHIDNTFNTAPALTINNNEIGSVLLLNLYGSYEVTDRLQISAAIKNALDHAPPLSPYPLLPVPQYNGEYYDVVGRAFKLGATYHF
jgi:iron complex outermembrane recepter protein